MSAFAPHLNKAGRSWLCFLIQRAIWTVRQPMVITRSGQGGVSKPTAFVADQGAFRQTSQQHVVKVNKRGETSAFTSYGQPKVLQGREIVCRFLGDRLSVPTQWDCRKATASSVCLSDLSPPDMRVCTISCQCLSGSWQPHFNCVTHQTRGAGDETRVLRD